MNFCTWPDSLNSVIDSTVSEQHVRDPLLEMVDYVNQFSQKTSDELTIDQRNILSVAFKNVVGTRRAAWRVISLIERKENKKGATQNAEKAKNYR